MNFRSRDRSHSKLRTNHYVPKTHNKASGFSSGRLYAVVSDARRSGFRTVCFIPRLDFCWGWKERSRATRSVRQQLSSRLRRPANPADSARDLYAHCDHYRIREPPSMRLARNFVAATTSQKVEIRPCVRLHDSLHVELLVAAFHGVDGWLPFLAPPV
jgi:hypothetical protein